MMSGDSAIDQIKSVMPEKTITLQASTLVAVLGFGGGAFQYGQGLEDKINSQAREMAGLRAEVRAIATRANSQPSVSDLRAEYERRITMLEARCFHADGSQEGTRR